MLSQKSFKQDCNKPFYALLVESTSDNNTVTADDRVDALCCGFRRWGECAKEMIANKCGDNGLNTFKQLIHRGLADLPDMICAQEFFKSSSDYCKKFDNFNLQDVSPKDIENLGKMNFLKFFSFLIQFDE